MQLNLFIRRRGGHKTESKGLHSYPIFKYVSVCLPLGCPGRYTAAVYRCLHLIWGATYPFLFLTSNRRYTTLSRFFFPCSLSLSLFPFLLFLFFFLRSRFFPARIYTGGALRSLVPLYFSSHRATIVALAHCNCRRLHNHFEIARFSREERKCEKQCESKHIEKKKNKMRNFKIYYINFSTRPFK